MSKKKTMSLHEAVRWYNDNTNAVESYIDTIVYEFVASHINADHVSWRYEKDMMDWQIAFTITQRIGHRSVTVTAATPCFEPYEPLADNTRTDFIIKLESTREYILKKLAEVAFRAKPYTFMGEELD